MAIVNYTLTEDQAEKANDVYFPGSEGNGKHLLFIERNDDRPNPLVVYQVRDVPRSRVQIFLHHDMPLIQHIDLCGDQKDIPKIIEAVESDLEIKL